LSAANNLLAQINANASAGTAATAHVAEADARGLIEARSDNTHGMGDE